MEHLTHLCDPFLKLDGIFDNPYFACKLMIFPTHCSRCVQTGDSLRCSNIWFGNFGSPQLRIATSMSVPDRHMSVTALTGGKTASQFLGPNQRAEL